ncbi:MAG: hypothetical protein QOI10_1159 [Solirubrobacterales bacterium]|nr:hypothetical protein [Solirubrobacterales bacterium]
MFASIRYFLADVGHWIWSHRLVSAAILVGALAAAAAIYLAAGGGDNGTAVSAEPAPAPRVVVKEVPAPENTDDLGFPSFATKNTTRVSGADAIADAAAVALAVYPSTGGVPGPDAVTLVDSGEWPAAVAAASLAAAPVSAPLLVSESGELPPLSATALRELDPQGSAATAGRQVFVIGAAAEPADFETLNVDGADAAEVAAEVARLRERLAGEPDQIVITSDEAAGYAMPAAGWAARSGDPVLFTDKDSLPDATVKALRRDDGVPVFVLGPESAISAATMKEIEHVAPGAQRVGEEGPVENAIAFARYANGNFGWNINDPGHGFVIANTDRPLDAAAAAPLSASGTWGPLLVTDDGAALPAPLRGYLLDLKPGYADDPTRALYNHVWLIGDTSALSVDLQAEVDELAEVAPVTSGSGSAATPAPTPESQPNEPQQPNPDQQK